MFTTDLTTPFTTAELQALQSLLQNETTWDRDRDADTGGFNAYYSATNPERVLIPIHEEEEWKLLNSAMLRIDIELERRQQQRQERFDYLSSAAPEAPEVPLDVRSQQSEIDHQVDFQYHRIGRD